MSPRFMAFVLASLLSVVACRSGEPCQSALAGEQTAGLVDQGGALLAPLDGKEYGLNIWCAPSELHILLQRLQDRDPTGKPRWIDLATLVVPRLRPGEVLAYGVITSCTLNGTEDPEVVALGRCMKDGTTLQIVKAWRANRAAGRFEVVSAPSFTCRSPDLCGEY
jgi:hypothetical protein